MHSRMLVAIVQIRCLGRPTTQDRLGDEALSSAHLSLLHTLIQHLSVLWTSERSMQQPLVSPLARAGSLASLRIWNTCLGSDRGVMTMDSHGDSLHQSSTNDRYPLDSNPSRPFDAAEAMGVGTITCGVDAWQRRRRTVAGECPECVICSRLTTACQQWTIPHDGGDRYQRVWNGLSSVLLLGC